MIEDLSVFADIGTDPPTAEATSNGPVIRLVRLGELTELQLSADGGSITEAVGDTLVRHVNFKALLASDRYGALREWARNQRAYLDLEIPKHIPLLELKGTLNNDLHLVGFDAIDNWLASK